MTRDELEHAIRAACDVADDSAVYVFGSQAILGEFPDAPPELRQSVEVDMTPVTRPDQVDRIDANLGELSQFHQSHGFYVHGIHIDETATLPPGWRDRVVHVSNDATRHKTGLCLDAYDLAASKLAAFRDKDRDFVRVLLFHRLLDPAQLQARVQSMEVVPSNKKDRWLRWIDLTERDLAK